MLKVVDLEDEFNIFNWPNFAESSSVNLIPLPFTQISSNQETTNVPKAMVLHRKNTSLLELLESHDRGTTPNVAINPQPLTPLLSRTSPIEPLKKKRKRDKKGKAAPKEGKIQPTMDWEPSKGAKATKGPKMRSTAKGFGAEVVPNRHIRVPAWNPMLKLNGTPLPMDSSIRYFQQGKAGYAANA